MDSEKFLDLLEEHGFSYKETGNKIGVYYHSERPFCLLDKNQDGEKMAKKFFEKGDNQDMDAVFADLKYDVSNEVGGNWSELDITRSALSRLEDFENCYIALKDEVDQILSPRNKNPEEESSKKYEYKPFRDKDLIVSGKDIVDLFNNLEKETLRSQDIYNLDDMYDYLEAQIKSNVQYDFGGISIDVQQETKLEQSRNYNIQNEKDWAVDYVEDEYKIKLTNEEAEDLGRRLADEVFNSDYLAEEQSYVECECIAEFVDELQQEKKKAKYAEPKRDAVKDSQNFKATSENKNIKNPKK